MSNKCNKSGRKERVVVSCVTFETVKVTDPILHYEATRAHLIRFTEESSELKRELYGEFFNEVKRIIKEKSKNTEIFSHEKNVYDFAEMLKTVLEIINEERKNDPSSDIYVNISAGPSEYAAASTIASMMVEGTIPFSVHTDSFKVDDESARIAYYENGIPIGLAKSVKDPIVIPRYSINMPEEHLVLALRLFDEGIEAGENVTASYMIAKLREDGLWYRKIFNEDGEVGRSELVYYQRDYKNKWIDAGWIEKNKITSKYQVTIDGKKVIDTYYR